MSDEKQQKQARPAEIAVRRVRFVRPIDVPGQSVTEGLDAIPVDPKRPGLARYEITFVPAMRHHLVTWYRPNEQPMRRYVHETQVATWEPVER